MDKVQELIERLHEQHSDLPEDDFKARVIREIENDPDLIAEAVQGTARDLVTFDAEMVRLWLKSGGLTAEDFAAAVARMKRH
jgi:hypothetical protein